MFYRFLSIKRSCGNTVIQLAKFIKKQNTCQCSGFSSWLDGKIRQPLFPLEVKLCNKELFSQV